MLDSGVSCKTMHGLPSTRTSKGILRVEIEIEMPPCGNCLSTDIERLLLWIRVK